MSRRTGDGFTLNTIVEGSLLYRQPGSPITYVKLKDERGWVFESLEDGRQVLKRLSRGVIWEEKREFFMLTRDTLVYSRPEFPSDTIKKRVKGSVAETSERLTTADGVYTFVKLRYCEGWLMQRCQADIFLESITEGPEEVYESSWYKVNRPLSVRVGPDIYSRSAAGAASKTVDSMVQCDLIYKPPRSRIHFLRLQNESGWLVERNEEGNSSLTAVAGGSREDGTFYFRTRTECVARISPEDTSAAVRKFLAYTMFRADCKLHVPGLNRVFIRIYGQHLWVPATDEKEVPCLEEVPRQVFRMYSTPQPWLAIGRPEKVWYKVPTDEGLAVLAEEALLAFKTFESTKTLGSASCGRDLVPLRRFGYFLTPDNKRNTVTVEEIKHPASNLTFSYAWKQIWWTFRLDGEVHTVELQHGLQGGSREVKVDGKTIVTSRSVGDLFWDSGSTHPLSVGSHECTVSITLEGSFFSFDLQFFRYDLLIDGQPLRQLTPGEEIDFDLDANLDV